MRNELKSVLAKLEKVRADVQGYLDRTEDEERQDKLETELSAIETAIEALRDID